MKLGFRDDEREWEEDLRRRLEVWILCLRSMSLAIFAGGPLSRKGLRAATTARPASRASRASSTDIMDSQTAGMKRYTKRRAARKELSVKVSILD